MRLRLTPRLRVATIVILALSGLLALVAAYVPRQASPRANADADVVPFCDETPQLCTETTQPWDINGNYTGHDEPSLLFYSTKPGSGNSSLYQLTLPTDPPTLPAQDGSGGTWSLQLHPTFWFGMALCDDQSAPLPGAVCTPDSDTNIFSSTNPNSANFMGLHPGTAFMEMQFYPSGWDRFGCTQTQWCAAMTIDSFSSNSTTGQVNNSACLSKAGEEYVNFAFITKSGNSQAPADPLRRTAATRTPGPDVLMMNDGDALSVDMHDTSDGFQVDITDHTTGQTGSMTASVANGFGHPEFDPSASTCTDLPYTFHPMYSTSTPDTRVLWAAHSYNIAYSDEVGHFEYCTENTPTTGRCSDPTGRDSDDSGCRLAPFGPDPHGNFANISGCTNTESDFDGPEYQPNWAGTNADPTTDAALHATPIRFTSPLFTGPGDSGLSNYRQAAFETDLPRIEGADTSPNNDCQRHVYNPTDANPGAGCVNPPNGATFYPIFTTTTVDGACVWQEGGALIPGTTNTFGGTSAAEYGPLMESVYPSVGNTTQGIYENFHQTLNKNPCPAPGGSVGGA